MLFLTYNWDKGNQIWIILHILWFCDFGRIVLMTGYVCGCDFHGRSLKSLSNLFVFIPNTPLSHLERNSCCQVQNHSADDVLKYGWVKNLYCVTQWTLRSSRHLMTQISDLRIIYRKYKFEPPLFYMCNSILCYFIHPLQYIICWL